MSNEQLRIELDLKASLENIKRQNLALYGINYVDRSLNSKIGECTKRINNLLNPEAEIKLVDNRAEKLKALENLVKERRDLLNERDEKKYTSNEVFVCRSLTGKISALTQKINRLNKELNFKKDVNTPFIPTKAEK